MRCYHANILLTVLAEDRQEAMDIIWERIQLTQIADGKGVLGAEFDPRTLAEVRRPTEMDPPGPWRRDDDAYPANEVAAREANA